MNHLIRICDKEIRVRGKVTRIARLEADKYMFLDNPEPIVDGLKKCGNGIDIFTFLQRLPDTSPRYSYPFEWDNFATLQLSTFDQWWNHQIGFKARNKAKQASKKGVEIREVGFNETLVRGICEIYNECPIRQGRRFPHYGKTFDETYREEATFLDHSVFIGAYFQETLIGFIKLVFDENRTQAGLMNIISKIEHRDKAPTNALVAQAVKSCTDRNIAYLVYSNFAYGNKQRSSLSDFKERNGFVRIDSPRYYVPLTTKGKIALQLGLHRRFVDRLPESLASKLRIMRESWYNRRFQSAEVL